MADTIRKSPSSIPQNNKTGGSAEKRSYARSGDGNKDEKQKKQEGPKEPPRKKKFALKNSTPPKKKKLTGIGFWAIFSLATFSDFLDIFLNITIILTVLVVFTSFVIFFIVYFYLFLQGVSFTAKKNATMFIALIIQMVPFLNILPSFPISLLVIRGMENNEHLKKLANKGLANAT